MEAVADKKRKKSAGRGARTIRSLMIMAVLGAVVTIYGIYSNSRDVNYAVGPKSEAQREFFIEASERPDIELFFRNIKPDQRLAMSQNIARYNDPALAKLIGKCLGTFDTEARKALTESMKVLAKAQPAAVAKELALTGSFQRLAVSSALRAAGSDVNPIVAERLTDGGARPNAAAFLVESGPAAVPALLPLLDHKDKDVRLAAADSLGKLRARESVRPLVKLYEASAGEEKAGYLGAIAGIGDPATEPLLTDAVFDEKLPSPQRSQAALGLGRVGSPSAVDKLWSLVDIEVPQIRLSAINGLQTAGDLSLTSPKGTLQQRLLVAEGIASQLSDSIISKSLSNPSLRGDAAAVAGDRETLVDPLVAGLAAVDPIAEGDVADALIRALLTTDQGLAALKEVQAPELKGLVERRLRMQSLSG